MTAVSVEQSLRDALVSLRNVVGLHDGTIGDCQICVAVRVADEALKYSDEATALRTGGLGPFCARFKTFQFIGDFVEKFQAGNPLQQLDLMHEYSDLIPKEIIGAGIYEYTPRVGAGVKE